LVKFSAFNFWFYIYKEICYFFLLGGSNILLLMSFIFSVFIQIRFCWESSKLFLVSEWSSKFFRTNVIDNLKTFLDDSQLGVMGIRVKRGVKVRYTPSASPNHNIAFQDCHLDNWPFNNLSYKPFVSKIWTVLKFI